MNTVADQDVCRLPGTLHLSRGDAPLNQRLADEIGQQLTDQGLDVQWLFKISRHTVIEIFRDLLLYAFRTEQLKSEPNFKLLGRWALARVDDDVIAEVLESYPSNNYDALVIVNEIVRAYKELGYTIYEP